LMTYVLLGAAAGGLGSVVDLAGPLTGIQHMAAIAAGALMVGFGVITWLRISGVKMSRIGLPKVLENAVNGSHQRAARLSPLGRALATGLLTTLLPCGWLYAFAITAAGTANVFSGALVMGTFWVGTLPALTALGAGIHKLSAPLARRVPMISAAAVIVVGLYTIAARSQVVLAAHAGHAATPASYETLMRRINALDEKALPCCTTQPEAK